MNCKTNGCMLIVVLVSKFPVQTLTNAIASKHDVTKLGELCSNDEWAKHKDVMLSREVKLKENFVARYVFRLK